VAYTVAEAWSGGWMGMGTLAAYVRERMNILEWRVQRLVVVVDDIVGYICAQRCQDKWVKLSV